MKVFSRKEVGGHCKEEDAYVIVNEAVLDVTRFAGMHPGGEKLLLQFAGQDATEVFYELHKQQVLDKFQSRLQVGIVEGLQEKKTGGVSEWGMLSKVPYAEPSFWRGWKSAYYDESHLLLRKEVREFYDKHVRQIAQDSEDNDEPCTSELMQKLGDEGLLACQLGPGPHLKLAPKLPAGIRPEKFDYFHEAIVHEEATRLHCPGFMDSMFAGFNISVPPVFNYGTPKMKKDILPALMCGKKRACLAITEPFAGSDVAGIKCTAEKSADGSCYIVNGVKKWITNSTFADYAVTCVRTGGLGAGGLSMLLIDMKTEGVRTKLIKTSYSSSAGTGYVIFENVKVPCENLMYKENKGFQAVMSNFNHERWVIAVGVIAGARYIVEECFKWATQRKAFGKPLMSQAVIREKLGKMVAEVESAHAYMEVITHQMNNMTYEEQAVQLSGPISLLKYQATRVSHNVADEAVQIFGGRGVTKGGMGRAVETYQRTYKMPAVYGGSEEIMVDLGVRQTLKSYPRDAKL